MATIGGQLSTPESGWQRIDDAQEYFRFSGNNWKITDNDANTYKGTAYYCDVNPSENKIEFSFYGTKLRIIDLLYNNRVNNVNVSIDGNVETYNPNSTSNVYQILLYEKTGLELGEHKCILSTTATTGTFSLDAIDIDEDGHMIETPVQIGDRLLRPKNGMKRIDDSDSLIKYTGTGWVTTNNDVYYNGQQHYTFNDGKILLNVFTSKIQIIDCLNTNRRDNISIIIDGEVAETYSTIGSGTQGLTLVYEKSNLEKKVHTIAISSNDSTGSKAFSLDAIDIDEDGYLVEVPVQIGEVLTQPSATWQRFDDSDVRIKFGSGFPSATSELAYNKTYHQCQDNSMSTNGEVTFSFTGTKFRIIGTTYSGYSNDVQVTVDGIVHGNMNCTDVSTAGTWQVLMYEATGLENKDHIVKLKMLNKTTFGYLVDAIDIDEDGILLEPPAQVGDQLLQPEDGWNRFDDSDSRIVKLSTSSGSNSGSLTDVNCYNSTACQLLGGEFKFNFYGTGVRILGLYSPASMYTSNVDVYIDDNKIGSYSQRTSSVQYQTIFFETSVDEGTHTLRLVNTDSACYMGLDSVDINGNGYLTEPDITIGDSLPEPAYSWKRFNDTSVSDGSLASTGDWINQSNAKFYANTVLYTNDAAASKTIYIACNKFRLISRKDTDRSTDCVIKIDNAEYPFNLNSATNTEPYMAMLFEKRFGDTNKVHKIEFIAGTDNTIKFLIDAIDINEDGHILTQAEYDEMQLGNFLIKTTSGYKTIESGTLKDITTDAAQALVELNKDYAENICFHKMTDITAALLKGLGTDWSIVSNSSFRVSNIAIKSNKQLVVGSGDFSTKLASNIDFFEAIYSIPNGCSIKCVVSNDSGKNWYTTSNNGNTWDKLTNIVALKAFNELTTEEAIQWDLFKEEIFTSGISLVNLSTINFNLLNSSMLRFAYVIYQEKALSTPANISKLDWQFDSIGLYKQMDASDLTVTVNNDNIMITSNKDVELLKLNVGVSSNKTKEQDLSGLLDKATFQGKESGSVKKADVAKTIEVSDDINGTIKYYGTANNDPELKLRNFPAGTVNDHIDNYQFNNLVKGVPQVIEFVKEIPDINCIPTALKYVEGPKGQEVVLEKYLDKSTIITRTDNLIESENGLSIVDTFNFNVNINNEGFYETEEINVESFNIISNLEVK